MLRKISLSLIACVITTQASALELYKAKLISHKKSTTGGVQAIYKNAPHLMKQFPADETLVYSGVVTQKVIMGRPAYINGYHNIEIYNDTNSTQEYLVNFSTCIDNQDNHGTNGNSRCAYLTDRFSVEPHGYFDDSMIPELIAQFNDLSPQTITAHVGVGKLQSEALVYNADSTATASLIVTAN